MLRLSLHQKSITSFILAVFIASHVLLLSSVMLIPKSADAFFPGLPTPTIKIADLYQVAKDIGLAALRQVALKFANKFLTNFVDKLTSKYKIRNYLYYDQVLTNFYLGNYIVDKIEDPDLRQIYLLLHQGYITGQDTGLTGAPDRRKALIPQIKKKIAKYYEDQGGIPTNSIYNPPANLSGVDYYSSAYLYFLNPPGFVENKTNADYSAFATEATTAAQLEIAVGNGLKANRIIGGTCGSSYLFDPKKSELGPIAYVFSTLGLIKSASAQEDPPLLESSNPVPDGIFTAPQTPQQSQQIKDYYLNNSLNPADCASRGGTWQPSALDKARAMIDNPSAFIDKYLGGAIDKLLGNQFDPNNYKAVIGTLLGDFLFNKLALSEPKGLLSEDPYLNLGTNAGLEPPTQSGNIEMDIDGDGVIDAYDNDNDGAADVCIYPGQAPPNCRGSVSVTEESTSNYEDTEGGLLNNINVNVNVNPNPSPEPEPGPTE